MFKQDETIDDFIVSAGNLFTNAATPAIAEKMLDYGYTPEKMAIGHDLYTESSAAVESQKKEYGEQYAATEAFNNMWKTVKAGYMKVVKVARIALREDYESIKLLQLFKKRERSYAKWLLQARQFLNLVNTNQKIIDALMEYNMVGRKITDVITGLDQLEESAKVQNKETGEAQSATKKRDELLDKLDDWLTGFVGIARIALEDDPQLIEMLDIKEES